MGVADGIYCGEYSFCTRCEKCVCKRFIHGIEDWFGPMPYQQKLAFFLGLLKRCNSTLVGCLLSSVRLSDGKERIYSLSKTNPNLDDMNEPPLRNIFSQRDVNMSMINVFLEFLTFSDYQKKKVLLHFFKQSDDRLLANLATQMHNMVEDGFSDRMTVSDSSEGEETESVVESKRAVTKEEPVKQAEPVDLDGVHSLEPLSNYESEDDGFAVEEDDLMAMVSKTSSKPSSSSKSKRKKQPKSIPIFTSKSGKDFISALPVGIAKRIFGYLDKVSLANCLCISTMWRQLAEEVRSEFQVQLDVAESVKLIQGTTAQLCNHRYARFTDVLVPNFDVDTGKCIADPRPKQVDENSPVYVNAFNGVSTRKVIMEERNVYCGPFNVMVVHDESDSHRVIHNDGGKLIASGSSNRLISLYDLTTGQELEQVLEGHSGSIRCIRISLADNLVFSGSYDTGIRVWDLASGKFTKVFNGHQATVLCLGYENQLIVSGSVDRTCRVWSLKSLRCIRKFYHRSAVTAVAIRTAYLEERIFSGDIRGNVKVWDLRTGGLIKVLHGHQAEVASIDADRWFIISGSKDNYIMGWSNQGDHKRCLFAFNHPNQVLSVSLRYLRVVSGCADGRIRIWSVINGNCIKVLRGNSRNEAVMSLDCRENILTVNTDSNVIVLKFEPVKYNYTTSELYLPDSSLKAQNARYIAGSDSENEMLDSNGDPLGGRNSRPHSAVRATRMHLLKCASREISGSRASQRSASSGWKSRSTESLFLPPGSSQSNRAPSSTKAKTLTNSFSDSGKSRETHSRLRSASTNSRPHTSPDARPKGRHSRRSLMQKNTYLPDPSIVSSMLDHRCYPLRHCDLEAARRIQGAATLPPWRKREIDDILKGVREQHRLLVERRQSIRSAKAEKRRALLAVPQTAGSESDGEASDEDEEMLTRLLPEQQADDKGIRRMTWSFHRSQVVSASTYSGTTPLEHIESDVRPPLTPAPQAPTLSGVQSNLRKTLTPGANPPSMPYVRVAVAESMRQNRDELVRTPPLRIVQERQSGEIRHGSMSLREKAPAATLTGAKHIGVSQAKLVENRQSSHRKLRSILIERQREKELELRNQSGRTPRHEPLLTREEAAEEEKQRLLQLAAQVESGGLAKPSNHPSRLVRTTEKNPVVVRQLPSPVVCSVFRDIVQTTIPKPVEIRVLNSSPQKKLTRRPASSSATLQRRPPSTAELSQRPISEPADLASPSEPLMRVPNYHSILSGLRNRVELLKVTQAQEAFRKADSKFDYRINGETSRPASANSTPRAPAGSKELVLQNPANYEQNSFLTTDNSSSYLANKARKLEIWRRKKWALLASGKLTPNQLHG